jgi:putative CocE/NonD family hydrolase
VYPPSEDYPDGYALLLSEGILRLRYRDDRPIGELIEPGQVYEIAIDLQPTGNVFKRGHRIRLDVTSSSFPEFDANPNTGEPLGQHTHTVVAHQRVYHDAVRASRIVLPLVPTARP